MVVRVSLITVSNLLRLDVLLFFKFCCLGIFIALVTVFEVGVSDFLWFWIKTKTVSGLDAVLAQCSLLSKTRNLVSSHSLSRFHSQSDF